jgi:hypothetical protein
MAAAADGATSGLPASALNEAALRGDRASDTAGADTAITFAVGAAEEGGVAATAAGASSADRAGFAGRAGSAGARFGSSTSVLGRSLGRDALTTTAIADAATTTEAEARTRDLRELRGASKRPSGEAPSAPRGARSISARRFASRSPHASRSVSATPSHRASCPIERSSR